MLVRCEKIGAPSPGTLEGESYCIEITVRRECSQPGTIDIRENTAKPVYLLSQNQP
jgi:hypothetical protein